MLLQQTATLAFHTLQEACNVSSPDALAVTLRRHGDCSLALSSIGFPCLPVVRPEIGELHEGEHAPPPAPYQIRNSNLSCIRQEILGHQFPAWRLGVIQTLQ